MRGVGKFFVPYRLNANVRKRGVVWVAGIFAVLGCTMVQAQVAAASLAHTPDVDVMHQQQMQQTAYEQQRRIELLQEPQELQFPEDTPTVAAPVSTPASTPTASANCLPYTGLRLELSHHLSARTQTELRSHIPNSCITQAVLRNMQQRIAQAYLKQGYFRLQLQQRKQDGGLIWNAAPAKIHAVRNATAINSHVLLPDAVGKAANIQDLDQALDQANRLPNRKVAIDVYPNKQGDIAVALSEVKGKTWRGSIGVDSQSNRSIENTQVRAQLVGGNILGIGDVASIYMLSSIPAKRNRHLRAAFASYSVPYGYWTFTANAGMSAYRTWIQLARSRITQSGKSQSFGLRAERVVSRGARHITSVHGQLNRQSVDNRIAEQTIQVQSAELTTATLGVQHTQLLASGSIGARAEVHQGLNAFGAHRHIQDSGLPNPQFTKINASIDVTHMHPLDTNRTKRLRVVHQIAGQYGAHSLPNVEQFSAGDVYSVRGTEAPLSGDSGAWIRNTAYLDISTQGKLSIHPYIGLDAGYVNWKEQHGKRQAASATAGLLLQHPSWDLNVSVSRARAHGTGIDGTQFDTQWRGTLRWLF